MSTRVRRSDDLHGCVRLTSIEGKRPAQSVRPSAAELARLRATIEAMLYPPISGTTRDTP